MFQSIDDFIAVGGFAVPSGAEPTPHESTAFFERYRGKVLLVSLRVVERGQVIDFRQFAGTIIGVDAESGVEVCLSGGQRFRLPADPEAFEVAERGEYRLRGSTEVVVNPGLLTVWSVQVAPLRTME